MGPHIVSPLCRTARGAVGAPAHTLCLGVELRGLGPPKGPTVVRAVRDAGSARQSGPLRICILVLGCRRSSISTHVSSVSHVSQSSRGTWSSRCMQRRRHTLRTTPTHRHTTHNGRLSRTIGHRAANISPHRWGGGRIPHTPEQHRHLTRQRSLDVAGALPSVLSRFSPVQLSESEIAVDLER